MAVYAWPTDRLLQPQVVAWGEANAVRGSGIPPLGADEQTSEVPFSHRWVCDLVLTPTSLKAERAVQEAWITRLRGGIHRTTFYHFQHPNPYGTISASAKTLSGALAQGATTASIGTTTGDTLLPGSMVGITTTAAVPLQVVRVVVGGTSAGGVLSFTFEPPLRASANNGAAVVLDRPAARFRLMDTSWKQTSAAFDAQPISLSFREDPNP